MQQNLADAKRAARGLMNVVGGVTARLQLEAALCGKGRLSIKNLWF